MNHELQKHHTGTSMPIHEAFHHFGEMLMTRYEHDAEAGWARLCRALGEEPDGQTAAADTRDATAPRIETGLRAARMPFDAVEALANASSIRSEDDRAETRALVLPARELLSDRSIRRFDAADSARVLDTVATVSEALIADRDERTALGLMWEAAPHVEALGRLDPRGFRVRRAWAAAQSDRGLHAVAERLLLGLKRDELRVMNAVAPETERLFLWAVGVGGRLSEAAAGFESLRTALDSEQVNLQEFLTNLECQRNWLLGQQGHTAEAEAGYADVIAERSIFLGRDHFETHDARHSLGKMLVFNGRGAQAIPVLESVWQDRCHTLGRDHHDTVESAKYLAIARVQADPRNKRLLKSTIDRLRTILRIQSRGRGPNHPTALDTSAWIALLRTAPSAPMVDLARTRTEVEDAPEQHDQVAPATVR
ncbi:hypothetical protein ACGFIX_18800 [Nocardia salmonicida]|uniref:hypothetical protein n=1 Tax=Nocardia salmonicida TaxID=53431 RepID=UPI00371E65A7